MHVHACFSHPFCKHLLWAIDRGIRCFRKAKVHPRYTMGSSFMEAYSNLIPTWALTFNWKKGNETFTRPLRCHGTCPWVRRLMPVDLWVHRIVSPEFVFANHQPSPRLNLNVSAVHSQNAIIKMLRDFTRPGWGIKIIKSQLQPLFCW